MLQLGYIAFIMIFTYVVLVRMNRSPTWQEMYVIAYIFTMGVEIVREVRPRLAEKMKQPTRHW